MVKIATSAAVDLRAEIFDLLSAVPDPEIPVINIVELGIVRDVETGDPPQVIITPTYTGCPATLMITKMVREKLDGNGFGYIGIRNQLSPAWTTDWITRKAKAKLKQYGIAPPHSSSESNVAPSCPRCESTNSLLVSEFGSTPCKALYKCQDCLEPFDEFKCH